MKKIYNKLNNLKLSPVLLIFIVIIFISILGISTAKSYALTSNLAQDLTVAKDAFVNNSLRIDGNLGIGSSEIAYRLNVAGEVNLDSVSFGKKPNIGQLNSLVTVGFVDDAINSYIAELNVNPLPPNSCDYQAKEVACYPPADNSYTYSLDSCPANRQYRYFEYEDYSPGGSCFLTTICCNESLPGGNPESDFSSYTIFK